MVCRWLELGACLWLLQGCAPRAQVPSVAPTPRVQASASTVTPSAPVAAAPPQDTTPTPAPLWAFLQLRAGADEPLLRWSLLRECRPEWAPELIQMLSQPMPDSSSDAGDAAFGHEYFWQTTAADLLGCSGANAAVEPLIGVLFDPKKSDIHESALAALAKLEPSFERAKALLAQPAQAPVAARIFGALGCKQATPLLIAAIERTSEPLARTAMAAALPDLPSHPDSSRALRLAFDQTPASTRMPDRDDPRRVLVDAAGRLPDPSLIPWLLQVAANANANHGADIEHAALKGLLALTRTEDLPKIRAAVARYGDEDVRARLAETETLLKGCRRNVACYESKMLDESAEPFTRYKSARVLSSLGNEQTALELVNALSSVREHHLGWYVAEVADSVLPDGSPRVATALADKLKARAAVLDPQDYGRELPLDSTLARLRARQRCR